jgi:hypothetical protein
MRALIGAALIAATLPSFAADIDVGVSIGISQPGVYGRIDIGQFPQPQVVMQRPVIIAPAPVVVRQQPVYLWVPPSQRVDWRRYCGRYNACGVPVYFVQDRWYRDHVERRQEHRDDRRHDRHDDRNGRRDDRHDDRHDRRDDRRDDRHGR